MKCLCLPPGMSPREPDYRTWLRITLPRQFQTPVFSPTHNFPLNDIFLTISSINSEYSDRIQHTLKLRKWPKTIKSIFKKSACRWWGKTGHSYMCLFLNEGHLKYIYCAYVPFYANSKTSCPIQFRRKYGSFYWITFIWQINFYLKIPIV